MSTLFYNFTHFKLIWLAIFILFTLIALILWASVLPWWRKRKIQRRWHKRRLRKEKG
jgi:hypothetical protein